MINQNRTRSLLLLFGLMIVPLAILLATYSLATADLDTPMATAPVVEAVKIDDQSSLAVSAPSMIDGPSCRNGVSGWHPIVADEINAGWSISFSVNFNSGPHTNGAEYVPMIRFRPVYDDDNQLTDAYTVVGKQLSDAPGQLGSLIEANPGFLWIVGNEVDRPDAIDENGNPDPVQDALLPEVYARAYHEAYHFIKDRDPSAMVANSALVMISDGRLQYLNLMWDSYQEQFGQPMPVDVWNMHAYNLAERHWGTPGTDARNDWAAAAVALGTDPNLALFSPDVNGSQNDPGLDSSLCPLDEVICFSEHDEIDLFKAQVVNMRQWMKDRGQQQKPLILSEFSTLFPFIEDEIGCFLSDENGQCFTPDRVSDYLDETIDYLESAADPNLGFAMDNNLLVQRWVWFTTQQRFENDLIATSNELVSLDDQITPMGVAYRDQIADQLLTETGVDLVVEYVTPFVGETITSTNTATATIGVTVRNRGVMATQQPITVRFVDTENARTQFAETVIPAGLGGCTTARATAEVSWTDLTPGVYFFEAQVGLGVDGPEELNEDKADNVGVGSVIINGNALYLPLSSSANK